MIAGRQCPGAEFRRDDGAGRGSFFDPLFERKIETVLGVGWRCGNCRAEIIRAGPAAAVLHAGNHEDADERVGILLAHFCDDAVVVINGVESGDRGIVPAVINDELAAAGFECERDWGRLR